MNATCDVRQRGGLADQSLEAGFQAVFGVDLFDINVGEFDQRLLFRHGTFEISRKLVNPAAVVQRLESS